MKKVNVFLLLIFVFFILFHSGYEVSAQPPFRGGNQVAVTGWADDTHYLFRNFDDEKKLVTYKVNIKTGKSEIYPAPKSEREQFADSLPPGIQLGMNDLISPDFKSAVIIKDNDLYFIARGDKELKRLTHDEAEEVNTRYSPDSRKLAYTKNRDLYVYDLLLNKEIRLTSDASKDIYNGYAAWVYFEEILGRPSRYAAFWWSPDGNRLAWLRFDESEVPWFTLNRLDEADGIHGVLEQVHYPKAGDPNPRVRMGIADLETGLTTWVKTDEAIDQYLAWPFWTPDSKQLAIQVVNRDQNNLSIILSDTQTGEYRKIYEESSKTWVEFHEDIQVLKNNTGFIIRTPRNGFENLLWVGWDGNLIKELTNCPFRITSIDKVDENQQVVWFSANGSESTDSHGFKVGFDGKGFLQITKGPGTHKLSISPGGSYSIDTWNSINNAGSIIAYDKKGKQLKEIHLFDQPDYDPAKYSRAEMVHIMTSDSLFSMPAIITYPLNFNPSGKYPVVFTIYGGPDSRNIYNRWPGTSPSWYAQNNIITFTVDHRGSGQFGRRGLDYMHRSLGKWEILDYADAVKWLRTKPFIDSTRMGITGSSYGGYMTCLALTKGADYWTHGIAGSSVTDYRLYDNIYTERYMDTPQDNPDGYRDGSALNFVKNYKGKLLITHGDMDDNVHMQNSVYLISKLQDEGKSFRFMLYPGGRHGWGGAKALHSRNEYNQFWQEHFFGK